MFFNRTFFFVVGTAIVAVALTLGLFGMGAYYYRTELVKVITGPSHVDTTAPIIQTDDTIPNIVEKTTPAVVSVVITADVPIIERYFEQYNPFGGFFGGGNGFSIPRQRQVGTEKQEVGGGTGFFVSKDGYLITNKHVVSTAGASYTVVTNSGDRYDATVVAKDPMLDIAVLKVASSSNDFPFLTFANEAPRLGEAVIAIGNALAEFPNSVSVGVVSGLARDIVAQDGMGSTESLEGLIQTDAAINHGNSGGPLLNTRGEVVGVNVAMADGSENIGFALPATTVAAVYQSVAKTGAIVRPFLGVRYVQIDQAVAKENNLSVDYGVILVRGQDQTALAVMPGSPADKAGLEENDIILSVNDENLDGSPRLETRLRQFAPGDTITLKVLHDGNERTVSVTLTEAPGE